MLLSQPRRLWERSRPVRKAGFYFLMISDFDKKNIGRILDDPDRFDWFTAQLLRLIAKADPFNRERIRRGFPEEVAAFEEWEREEWERNPPKP